MSAYRLKYQLENKIVTIVAAKAVNTRVPPSAPKNAIDKGTGAWVEVQNRAGITLWRRTLDENFLAGEARLQLGDGIGTMTRVPVKKVTEQILVPFVADGVALFLYRDKPGAKPRVLTEHKF